MIIIIAEYFYRKACLIIGPSEALSRANCKRHCRELDVHEIIVHPLPQNKQRMQL